MTTTPTSGEKVHAQEEALRRRLVRAAAATAVLATIHFLDHAVRGQLVLDRGLDPAWNHSGWPFQPRITPFTVSLVAVYGLLLGGIALTVRGRLWAGYWLATAVALTALVTRVHFFGGTRAELPSVILRTFGNAALGIPALIVVFAILGSLAFMAVQAIWVRRVSGRW